MRRFKRFLDRKTPAGQPPAQNPQQAPLNAPPRQAPVPAPVPGPVPGPEHPPPRLDIPGTAPAGTLNIALVNKTTSSTVYAYITGQALDNNNAIYILQADGKTPYYPTSPSSTGSPLAQNCAIPLGNPGNTLTINIPHIAGGRIWFSIDNPLTFLLNPGPALVEPSVTNSSDPNINIDWGFCEFTFNTDQLYANISYVDFVSLPIALNLTTANSGTQSVLGMPPNGLDQVCSQLQTQANTDRQGWDKLIVTRNGRNLRALSPNQGMVGNSTLFQNYYDAYTDQAWTKFSTQQISIDTQASFGIVYASVSASGAGGSGTLNFGANSSFTKPSTRDIFTCSTGPFATGQNAETNAIIPRLAAAFNRSTLLKTNSSPASQDLYYQEAVTNHYSRICHAVNLDGKGYAFPYDDVQPTGGKDQSGEVHAGDPVLFTITVGGNQ